MSLFKGAFITGLCAASIIANAEYWNNKVIYGDDDREDVFASAHTDFVEWSKSTAAMIPPANIKSYNAVESLISAESLEEAGMCKKERFSQQPTAALCSGFLVSKNLLVTAGHCINTQSDCDAYKWVFDFKVDYEDQEEVIVDKSDVYGCKKIVNFAATDQNDFSLIELDRDVTNRKALKFRRSGTIETGANLVVIGHPTGLPTKIANGAVVRSVTTDYFTTNLDTYGGNSGSAVFNVDTGRVEGILVRGATDYVYDYSLGCQVSNVLGSTEGRGEDVTKITNIAELKDLPEEDEDDQDQGDVGQGDEDQDDHQDDEDDLPWWWRWFFPRWF